MQDFRVNYSGIPPTPTSNISPTSSSGSSISLFHREDTNDLIFGSPLTPANLDTSCVLSGQTQLHLWAFLFNHNINHNINGDRHFERPKCRKCGDKTVLSLNDDGRPFYHCVVKHKDNFSCYADLLGYDAHNPVCLCGQPSRVNYNRVGVVYYTCVTGGCGLFRFKR